jgi:hypothetical protein
VRLVLALAALVLASRPADAAVPIIFDTDIGNDVDDVLALGVLHALQSRGACELLAVTITKDHDLAGPFADAVNTFYGRPQIPVGVVRKGVTPQEGKFLGLARDPAYPHALKKSADAPDAVALLRKVLAARPDGSVVIVQVGFATNLARLLDSPADDVSPLTGKELAAKDAATRVREGEKNKSFAFYSVGVEGANFDILKEIGTRQPLALKGYSFREMFVWLSQSQRSVSHSNPGEEGQVKLASPAGWAQQD